MRQQNVIWNRDTWVAVVSRLAAKEHVVKVSRRIEQIEILLILDQHKAIDEDDPLSNSMGLASRELGTLKFVDAVIMR